MSRRNLSTKKASIEITDFSAPALHGFIAANGAPGITIRTDVWSGYPGVPDVAHDPHVIGPTAAHVVLPWIDRASFSARRHMAQIMNT